LVRRDGHRRFAVVACLETRPVIAPRVSGVPRQVGNRGSPGWPWRSCIQTRSTPTVWLDNGVQRCWGAGKERVTTSKRRT
jgi:hypothetical protein